MSKYISCIATIEGPSDAKPFKWPCTSDPNKRWNGWAQPYFTKEVMLKVLSDIEVEVTHVYDAEIVYKLDGEECRADLTKHGWTIYGFCFDLVDEEGNYI